VWEAALPYLRARKNDVHIPLSYAYAERLLESHPDADRDVVLLAILLHDIGWAVVDQDELARGETPGPEMHSSDLRAMHEREGARLAREILGGLDYPAEVVDEVAAIIAGHDSRPDALSLNDALVKDADKLWRYTSAGIGVACHWFGFTPAEYADWVGRQIDDVIFTDEAVAMAREALAVTERELRFDVLAPVGGRSGG
jgi:HD superfamily phosphodiesterase